MPDDDDSDTDWYSNETATFGDRLAGAREAVGMSRADLAQRLGIREKTLAGWEDDYGEPRANRLNMLAGLLNVSLRWLMTGEGEGLTKPVDLSEVPDDVAEMLTELRQLQRDLIQTSDRLGRLEKRLRLGIVQGAF